jgi:hypothetical protein
MTSWLGIRTKTEAKALNAVRSRILGWPEEVLRDVYKPQIQDIGREGVEFIRDVIRTSETKTGRKRQEEGRGEAGRIKTGKMIKAVRAEVRDRKVGFTMNVGWVRGQPGYAIFQELGTDGEPGDDMFRGRAGIRGMDAIGQAHEFMLMRMRQLAKGTYKGDRNFSLELSD